MDMFFDSYWKISFIMSFEIPSYLHHSSQGELGVLVYMTCHVWAFSIWKKKMLEDTGIKRSFIFQWKF